MDQQTTQAVRLRPAVRSDENLLFHSFLRSYRDGDAVRNIPDNLYFGYYHKVLERLFKSSTVLMLVDGKDPNQIYGYLVYEMWGDSSLGKVMVLHYAYMKKYARMGAYFPRVLQVVMELEQPSAVFYTHRTGAWKRYLKRHKLGKDSEVPFVYNPFLVWVGMPTGWQLSSAAQGENSNG